ncbi:hypothetical protein ACIBEJ_35000 [Nonomuraea sp. NPDC050790]|uniref:hypothetical protein n=1 Tax=Nonomuraea sp. NPDC050790 TaxID=3364371 RepID=UPI0037AC54DE
MARQARRCKGRKTNGDPCNNYAINGGMVCHAHGGRAKQVKAKAAERAAEDKVRAALARMDVDPVADPLTELAKIAGQVVAWKDTLADKVNELSSLRYSTENGEQLRAEVALFERALDRCEKFLSAMARLNIDERLARISERQADVIIKAITATLAERGLSAEEQAEARREVARRLRVASSG